MIWFKACPKCHGDLCLDSDHFGNYQTCMQCGYMKDLAEPNRRAATATPVRRSKNPSRRIMVAAD